MNLEHPPKAVCCWKGKIFVRALDEISIIAFAMFLLLGHNVDISAAALVVRMSGDDVRVTST